MIARFMGFIVALILTVHGYLWGDMLVFVCGLLSFGIVGFAPWRSRHTVTYPTIYTRRERTKPAGPLYGSWRNDDNDEDNS